MKRSREDEEEENVRSQPAKVHHDFRLPDFQTWIPAERVTEICVGDVFIMQQGIAVIVLAHQKDTTFTVGYSAITPQALEDFGIKSVDSSAFQFKCHLKNVRTWEARQLLDLLCMFYSVGNQEELIAPIFNRIHRYSTVFTET